MLYLSSGRAAEAERIPRAAATINNNFLIMDKDIIIPFYNTPQRQRLTDSENGFILFQQTAADEKNGVEREGAHGHSSGVGGDFECHTPGKRG